jgi:hypothetical protein
MDIMWLKQCHKPSIWEWLESHPFMVMTGDGLWHCFNHIIHNKYTHEWIDGHPPMRLLNIQSIAHSTRGYA